MGLFVYVLNRICMDYCANDYHNNYSLGACDAPKVYESNATMLFLTKEKAQILGIEKIAIEQDNAAINREIQLFKSRLLVERIVDSLPLEMAYFKEGKTKFTLLELYNNCPFETEWQLKIQIYFACLYILTLLMKKNFQSIISIKTVS